MLLSIGALLHRNFSMLIEIFRSKSYFVIPIYCKRIEFKGLEIFRIRQLPTDTLIK